MHDFKIKSVDYHLVVTLECSSCKNDTVSKVTQKHVSYNQNNNHGRKRILMTMIRIPAK